MMRKIFLIILFPIIVSAQFVYDKHDVEICNSKFELALEGGLKNLQIGDVIVEIGKSFLGTPYKAHTLENSETEKVVIHLSGLDCYTFYESSLALARCVKLNSMSFNDYLNQIELIRYRDGKRVDYPSRLHYAVDWMLDNQKRGIVKDITKDIGGVLIDRKVNFMSTHPQYYKHLDGNKVFIQKMKEIEDRINKNKFYYVPQDQISSVESQIHSGDIIFCTTDIEGLIVGHTGLAVKGEDGRIHFLHAPNVGKKVQITKKPLSDYVKSVKKHTGIMVIRPLEPETN